MKSLDEIVYSNRDVLTEKVINYAKLHNYISYTSILPEVWRTAVYGMVEAFLTALRDQGTIREVDFYDDYSRDALSAFGIEEARKHRYRGVSLEMFLGLMKYFRRSFYDLVLEQEMEINEKRRSYHMVERFFDHIEIGFCLEWTGEQRDELVEKMRAANMQLAYEKNKYISVFESLACPIILLNRQHRVENMNYSAQEMLGAADFQNTANHDMGQDQLSVEQLMPWLADEFFKFISGYEKLAMVEKEVLLKDNEKRHLLIKLHRLLDVSDSLKGTVIIFDDLTENKKAEEALRYMSFHDVLTGLFNRAYFEQEMLRLENGRFDPLGIISFDVDGLKLVNDILGHQAGDRLLDTAAAVIHSCFREYDVVARIGGDEFAVILPHSSAEVVEQACQRMREAVDKHNQDNPLVPLSISQGWAVRDDNSISLNRVYQEADHRMYREKPWNREVFYKQFYDSYAKFSNQLYRDA